MYSGVAVTNLSVCSVSWVCAIRLLNVEGGHVDLHGSDMNQCTLLHAVSLLHTQ